jgi:6-pyruvoyl-tetrahydropterin synthase
MMSCLFVEQLTVIDCAYLDAARGLVGESWIVDIELEGELDSQSMVLDFGEVKRRLKRLIDDCFDHALLLPQHASGLMLAILPERVELAFESALGPIEHVSPPAAVALLETDRIDTAVLERDLAARLTQEAPANVAAVRVQLRHEAIDGAWYHYVHGLKKHRGHCQRIAHGHRSRIEIRVDGKRDRGLEQTLASAWTDIYLGTREDVIARGPQQVRFAYEAPEGHFELALPENRVDLLDTDSTVERIAEHLARRAAAQRPDAAVEVRAYEGVMKGAIARA